MSPLVLSLLIVLVFSHVIYTWTIAIRDGRKARTRSGPIHSQGDWPSVSILIPAWNEKGTLLDCLTSLVSIQYPSWECIVIAGGPDGTYAEAQDFARKSTHIRVIEQGAGGKNQALNQGLRAAGNDVIAILDADSVVQPVWLKELIAPISAGYQAVTGRSWPKKETWVSLCEQIDVISSYDVHRSSTLQGNASIAFRRSIIDAMGGFPEQVKVGVDWDLDVRLLEKNVMKAASPHARLLTDRPATLREFWKNEVRWRRAHLKSLFVHSGEFLATPWVAFRNLYFYVLAIFAIFFSLVALVALFGGLLWVFQLWSIFVVWISLRRAAVVGEVVAYTGNWQWLRYVWTQWILLWLTFLAVLVAVFTWRSNVVHFKGPRSQVVGLNGD